MVCRGEKNGEEEGENNGGGRRRRSSTNISGGVAGGRREKRLAGLMKRKLTTDHSDSEGRKKAVGLSPLTYCNLSGYFEGKEEKMIGKT